MDLNIDPKDVMELAAQKVADAVLEQYDNVYETASNRITEHIDSVISEEVRQSMIDTIDAKLAAEIDTILKQKIVPVDMWGEAKGEPSTIREQLHKRALEYWEERVEPDRNNSGRYRRTSYGGSPRHTLVFKDVAEEAFRDAMKANVNEMVSAFREAMRRDAGKMVADHIDSIINNKVLNRT